jgi:hypothetical protein
MKLLQRLKDIRLSLSSGIEPRFDPRCQGSTIDTLYPGADRPALSRLSSFGDFSMTHNKYSVLP